MLVVLPDRYRAGFTLVELVVGIAIIAITMTLAVPSYRAWIQNTRIRTAAESIQNGIQVARAEAVKRNASVQFDLRGANSAWTICVKPVVPGSCPNPDDAATIQSRANSEGSSSDITILSSDASPYVFNSFGTLTSPTPAAADGFIRIAVDVDPAVLSAAESRNLNVIVGVGGAVRLCDPDTGLSLTDPRRCP